MSPPSSEKTVTLAQTLIQLVEGTRKEIGELKTSVAVLAERLEGAGLKDIRAATTDHERDISELKTNWKWLAAIFGFVGSLPGFILTLWQLLKGGK